MMGVLEGKDIPAIVHKAATPEERSDDTWDVTVLVDHVPHKKAAAKHLMDIIWVKMLDYKSIPDDSDDDKKKDDNNDQDQEEAEDVEGEPEEPELPEDLGEIEDID